MRRSCMTIILFAFFSGIVTVPETAQAGWPWQKQTVNGMKKYSPEWWAYTGSLPVGTRQVHRYGKLWPPRPRPTDPQQTFMQQFHAAHYWPTPYVQHDRDIVKVFEAAQINQGWKNATTLYDYHFDKVTHNLTKSGREHVLWVMQNPARCESVLHIQASTEKSINTMRLASVSNYLAEISSLTGRTMNVLLDVTTPITRPAVEVQMYQKAWLDGMIAPHISTSDSGSDSGGN